MNPAAYTLYREHGIDIMTEPLEIAVCAQHNNGGLAGNHWWESANVRHLFPVGEVNGSHGVYRPGGSALNAGQVGAFRAAEYIANRYAGWDLPTARVKQAAVAALSDIYHWLQCSPTAERSWQEERTELQERMTRAGAHIRPMAAVSQAVQEAWTQWERIRDRSCTHATAEELPEVMRNRHLCYAHAVYLKAIHYALKSGLGSRGSAIVLDEDGVQIHKKLGTAWHIMPEAPSFRDQVLETSIHDDGSVTHEWVARRPIPDTDTWFENVWAEFQNGTIFE
jgi:succinate dehydrogenase/fumarate reductase flavoprotein subunit